MKRAIPRARRNGKLKARQRRAAYRKEEGIYFPPVRSERDELRRLATSKRACLERMAQSDSEFAGRRLEFGEARLLFAAIPKIREIAKDMGAQESEADE